MERIKSSLRKIKEQEVRLRKEIKEKTTGYILAAFSFVAGLAWNEAIKSLIDQLFPFSKDGILVKFFYAVIVTLVIVIMTIYLVKLIEKKEN